MKVNIGSGPNPKEGYINVDLDPDYHPEVVSSATCIPLESNSADVVESYHLIEHLGASEAELALKEWFRLLKPSGRLIVECPDLQKVCKHLVESENYTNWSHRGMWGLYGDTSHGALYGHKWGYTPTTLAAAMRRAGFTKIKNLRALTHDPERDMRLEAQKPQHPFEFRFADVSRESATTPRVFWCLAGTRSGTASSRIHGFAIHDYLKRNGWKSHILVEPLSHVVAVPDIAFSVRDLCETRAVQAGDIVIFQKVQGPRTLAALEHLAGIGAKSVILDCDWPRKSQEARLADYVICSSQYLAKSYRESGDNERAIYIPDAIEHIGDRKDSTDTGDKLRAVWFGGQDKWEHVDFVKQVLGSSQVPYKLTTISNFSGSTELWNSASHRTIARHDVAMIPITDMSPGALSKSSNRALLAMAQGLPVIATPIPAYQEVICDGENGFLCESISEWHSALQTVSDPATRLRIGNAAHELATSFFGIKQVGELWEAALIAMANGEESPRTSWREGWRIRRLRQRAFVTMGRERSPRLQTRVRYAWTAIREWPFDPWFVRPATFRNAAKRIALAVGRKVGHRVEASS